MPIDATWTIGARDRTKRALTSAGKGVDGFGAKFTSFGSTAAKGFGVAAAAIAGFGLKAVSDFTKRGDEIDKASQRIGVGAEEFQRLAFAAEQSGSGLEDVEKGIAAMSRRINDANNGLSSAKRSFDAIGVSLDDLNGASPEEQFQILAQALADTDDQTVRLATSQEIFGRAGRQLQPLIAQGAQGIKALGDEAERTGNVMSTQATKDAAALTDSMNTLRHTVGGLIGQAVAPLLPALTAISQTIATDLLPRFSGLIGPITEIAVALLPPLTIALDAAAVVIDTVVAPALGLLADVLDTQVGRALVVATGAVIALNAASAANPYALLAAAAVAAAAAIITHWEPISRFFTGLWENLKALGQWVVDVFTANWQWIAAAALGPLGIAIKLLIDNWDAVRAAMETVASYITGAFAGAWRAGQQFVRLSANAIIGAAEAMANAVIESINSIIRAWNSIELKIPGFKIEIPFAPDINFGGATIGVPDLPTIPTVTIPRLAQGGYVARPTLAIVGDAPGGEYVTPARQMRRQDRPINLRIILELDGQTLREITLDNVNEGLRSGEVSAVAEFA